MWRLSALFSGLCCLAGVFWSVVGGGRFGVVGAGVSRSCLCTGADVPLTPDWMGLGWDEGEHSCVAGGGGAVGWMGGGVSGSGFQCS